MNLDTFRANTKDAEGNCELVIVSADTGHTYELSSVSLCMHDPVVLLHAKVVDPRDNQIARLTQELAKVKAELEALRKDGLAF